MERRLISSLKFHAFHGTRGSVCSTIYLRMNYVRTTYAPTVSSTKAQCTPTHREPWSFTHQQRSDHIACETFFRDGIIFIFTTFCLRSSCLGSLTHPNSTNFLVKGIVLPFDSALTTEKTQNFWFVVRTSSFSNPINRISGDWTLYHLIAIHFIPFLRAFYIEKDFFPVMKFLVKMTFFQCFKKVETSAQSF